MRIPMSFRPRFRAAAAGCVPVLAAVLTFAQAPPASPSAESIKRAEELLAAARSALGGEKLSAVKTLTATGRTRRVRGDNLVPIEFELLVELPDKYVRIDEFPAEDTEPTSSGFNGDALIQIPPPRAGLLKDAVHRRPAVAGPSWIRGGRGSPPSSRTSHGSRLDCWPRHPPLR